jgi:hypothetical protein
MPESPRSITQTAALLAAEAIEALATIMRNPEAPAAARIKAASAILDRGLGKVTQQVEITQSGLGDLSDEELTWFIRQCATEIESGKVQ